MGVIAQFLGDKGADILVQIIGYIGTALLIVSYQQRARKKILLVQAFASAAFLTHFLMLGALTGCLMNVIGLFRSFVYSQSDKKWAKSPFWMILFLIAFTTAGVLTWENIYSLFPTVAMILSTVSFWLKSPAKVRFLTFPASPMWLIYNIVNGSYPGIVTESFVMLSIIVAIIRYDVLKKETNY